MVRRGGQVRCEATIDSGTIWLCSAIVPMDFQAYLARAKKQDHDLILLSAPENIPRDWRERPPSIALCAAVGHVAVRLLG
jgi:hypothetical protein